MKKQWLSILLTALLCAVCALGLAEVEWYVVPAWTLTEEQLSRADRVADFDYSNYMDLGIIQNDMAEFTVEIVETDTYDYIVLPDDTVSVLKIKRGTADVIIPDRIDGRAVTGLGTNYPGVKLEGVGREDGTKSLTLPAQLRFIGYSDIYLPKVKNFKIPDTVEILYWNAGFTLGSGTVEFPKEMLYIGEGVDFYGPRKLILPQRVEYMAEYALSDNEFAELTLPAYVGTMEHSVFAECKRLSKVNFTEGLTQLGEKMFHNCVKLQSLALPASLQTIGAEAFAGCKALSKLTFAKDGSLQSIGTRAFSECAALQRLTLPDGVESIGEEAFYGCKKLTALAIPASVKHIGQNAFLGCAAKLVLTVEEGSYADEWANENGVAVKYISQK